MDKAMARASKSSTGRTSVEPVKNDPSESYANRIGEIDRIVPGWVDKQQAWKTEDVEAKLAGKEQLSENLCETLLILEFASRTYQAISETEKVSLLHSYQEVKGTLPDVRPIKEADQLVYKKELLDYLGSKSLSPHAQEALALWLAAQVELTNEVEALNAEIANPCYQGPHLTLTYKAPRGFKRAIASLYDRTANRLEREGNWYLADIARNIAECISDDSDEPVIGPAEALRRILWRMDRYDPQRTQIKASRAPDPVVYEEILKKLAQILTVPSPVKPAPAGEKPYPDLRFPGPN